MLHIDPTIEKGWTKFIVSYANGSPSFVRKVRKNSLTQGSSARPVTLLLGTSFLHINEALPYYNQWSQKQFFLLFDKTLNVFCESHVDEFLTFDG